MPPPQWGGVDLGSDNSGCARLGGSKVGKQAARCPGTFSSPARPAPARALTPRPRWNLALAATVPGAWHLYQPEFRTNSRRANAAASQPSPPRTTQPLPNRLHHEPPAVFTAERLPKAVR